MTRPSTPTAMRITPTVWTLNPGALTLTAKSRIAPTAIRKMLVPRPIPPSFVRQVRTSYVPVCKGHQPFAVWGAALGAPGIVAQVDDALPDRNGYRLQFGMRSELREDGLDVLADGV